MLKILKEYLYKIILVKKGYFDCNYYLSEYEDVKNAKIDPYFHYLNYGWKEGRNPSKSFNTLFYLNEYKDVKDANVNPLIHFLKNGKKENRKTNFDITYCKKYFLNKKINVVFDHGLGGGADLYFEKNLAKNISVNDALLRVQYYLDKKEYAIKIYDRNGLEKDINRITFEVINDLLFKINIEKIIVNNLVGYPKLKAILDLINEIKIHSKTKQVVFKVHDYYCLCPSYFLLDKNKKYCGVQSNEIICKQCLDSFEFKPYDIENGFNITEWRMIWKEFLIKTVDVVEVFSETSKTIIENNYAEVSSKIILKPHKTNAIPTNKLRIGIIAYLSEAKGANVIKECLEYVEENNINFISFVLFGENPLGIKSDFLIETGKYERNKLFELLVANNIDAIIIPSIWPETFSYTTSEAISINYPVFCFDIGGQAEQVKKYKNGYILESKNPAYILDSITKVINGIKKSCVNNNNDELAISYETNEASPELDASISKNDDYNAKYLDYLFNNRFYNKDFVKDNEFNDEIVNKTKIIAMYLPQYHDFEENVRWFGKGFSEWTNTSKTFPQYIGHWQPHVPIDVGYYNLNNIDVMKRQIELAKKYGIYGFGFYYYWFSGKKIMEKPLEKFLADKSLEMPFFLFWANEDWTMLWDNGEYKEVLYEHKIENDDAEKFMLDILPYMKDSRYIKIDNKPMLCVYQPENIPHNTYVSFINAINNIAIKNGFNGIYLISPLKENYDFNCLENIQNKYSLNALFEFYPLGLHNKMKKKETKFANENNSSICFDVNDYIENKSYIFETKANLMKGIFPNWDNTPRRVLQGATIFESCPENYKKWLSDIIKWTNNNKNINERFVFINAWNEWAEGAHIEPDSKYGYAFLAKTREALIETQDE